MAISVGSAILAVNANSLVHPARKAAAIGEFKAIGADVLFLLDARLVKSSNRIDKITTPIDTRHILIDSCDRAKPGGFLILYKYDIACTVLASSPRAVTVAISKLGKHTVKVTCVYAPAKIKTRKAFWLSGAGTPQADTDIWFGDFNEKAGFESEEFKRITPSHFLDSFVHPLVSHIGPVDTFTSNGNSRRIDRIYLRQSSPCLQHGCVTKHSRFINSDHMALHVLLSKDSRVLERRSFPHALRDDASLAKDIRASCEKHSLDFPAVKRAISKLLVKAAARYRDLRSRAAAARRGMITDAGLLDFSWNTTESDRLNAERKLNMAISELNRAHSRFDAHKFVSSTRNKDDRAIPQVCLNGTTYTLPRVSEAAAIFYTDIYKEEPSSPSGRSLLAHFASCWKEINKSDLKSMMNPISIDTVEYTLKSRSPNKSPGPDCIPSWVYKDFAHELAPSLTALFNTIITEAAPLPEDFHHSVSFRMYLVS